MIFNVDEFFDGKSTRITEDLLTTLDEAVDVVRVQGEINVDSEVVGRQQRTKRNQGHVRNGPRPVPKRSEVYSPKKATPRPALPMPPTRPHQSSVRPDTQSGNNDTKKGDNNGRTFGRCLTRTATSCLPKPVSSRKMSLQTTKPELTQKSPPAPSRFRRFSTSVLSIASR